MLAAGSAGACLALVLGGLLGGDLPASGIAIVVLAGLAVLLGVAAIRIQSDTSPVEPSGSLSYREIIDAIGQPMVIVDPGGTVLAANTIALVQLGYPRDRLEGSPVATLLPDFASLARRQAETYRTNPIGLSLTTQPNTTARLSSGRLVPAVASIARSSDGLLLVTVRDVAAAQAGLRRRQFLRDARDLLSNSLDYEETVQTIARLATTALAEWCAIHVRDPDGTIRRIALARSPGEPTHLDRDDLPLEPTVPLGVVEVIRSAKSELYHQVPDLLLRTWARTTITDPTRPESAIVVPLVARGVPIGALSLAATSRRLDTNDLGVAESLASLAASALDSAALVRALREAVASREESLAHLDTIMRTAPVGLLFCNPDLAVADLNVRAAELLAPDGWPADHRDGHLRGALGRLIEEQVRQVFETGLAIHDIELEPIGEGARRSVIASLYPVLRDRSVVQVGGVLVDNTQRRDAEELLVYRLEFEQLLAAVSTQFINLPQDRLDEGLADLLRSVGGFLGVDRAAVALFADGGEAAEIRYHWQTDGPAAAVWEPRFATSDFPWILDRLRAFEPVQASRLEEIDAEVERGLLGAAGVRSFLAVPLVARGQAIGLLSVATVDQTIDWTTLDVGFLHLVGVLVVSALERKRGDALQREAERLEGIDLAAREMAHLINNDLTGAIGVFELLLASPESVTRYEPLVRGALGNLLRAADHLQQFQSVARVETKETAVGPALDLTRSVGAQPR
ncbi:MAG: GAF domain-containing protein [Dehalococcoidia bacterium]